MLSGSMSDLCGRRRVFQIGLLLFLAGSLLCSLAHTIDQLMAYRALQGLGASMLNPVALSIIANILLNPRHERRRGRVGRSGRCSAGCGSASWRRAYASCRLAFEFLDQHADWYRCHCPCGNVCPESKAARARAFDPVGQGLVFSG